MIRQSWSSNIPLRNRKKGHVNASDIYGLEFIVNFIKAGNEREVAALDFWGAKPRNANGIAMQEKHMQEKHRFTFERSVLLCFDSLCQKFVMHRFTTEKVAS